MAEDQEILQAREMWQLKQDIETLKARLAIVDLAIAEHVEFRANAKGIILLFKFIGLLAGAGSVLAFFVDFAAKKG